MYMKRGALTWDYIGKILIGVAFLLILALVIWMFKGNLYDVFEKFKEVVTFGG